MIPDLDADVLITNGTVVTFDSVITDALHTVRIDGTLQFAVDIDTQLKADTIFVDGSGTLLVGTEDAPIHDDVAARIVIADTGAIDTHWDPTLLSRGLISHGAVEMYGQYVTPYVALAADPQQHSSQIVLAEAPVNWEVGDRLVIPSSSRWHTQNQDEEVEILAIDGNIVSLTAPLEFNHHSPMLHGLTQYVANMDRNVVIISENPEDTDRRGHTMFMHNSNVNINNVGFYGLGRTDKRNPINDPVLDDDGHLIDGTGLNTRARYSVHFHRTGATYDDQPAIVAGSVVVDSPGWGYVNHDSYVIMRDNVAFNVVGASFVTEFGNEIGSFERNMSIRTTGSGDGLQDRQDIFDFGHGGHGFWLQGPGVEVVDNISVGNAESGYIYFTASSEAQFSAANLDDPSLAAGRDFVPVGTVPIKRFEGNLTYASRLGLETWFHLTHVNDAHSVIEDFTSWATAYRSIRNPYTGHTTFKNIVAVGDRQDFSSRIGINGNDVTNNITYENVDIRGFEIGIEMPRRGANVINGGYFETVNAIYIEGAKDTIRTIDINGDIKFATLSDEQLHGREQFDIFMDGSVDVRNRDLETFFSPDIVRLGTIRLNGLQVYYHKQAADYVMFTADDAPDFIPQELIGKTNQEIWGRLRDRPSRDDRPVGRRRA